MNKQLKIRKIELINRIQQMDAKEFENLLQRVNGQAICHDPFAKIRENHGIKTENDGKTGQN